MISQQKSPRLSIGVLCCRTLEREVRQVIRSLGHEPYVHRMEILEWDLHVQPETLRSTVEQRIRAMENHVDAVMLGYGRCQAMDRLPGDFRIPVLYARAEDCIGVLLGPDRYAQELEKEAGTWFLTAGWAELGMNRIFQELQLHRLVERGYDPIQIARRVFKDYTRALVIDVGTIAEDVLMAQAEGIARQFHWKLERVSGTLDLIEKTWKQTLSAARRMISRDASPCDGTDDSPSP